jgi:hypothetical protein
MKHLFFLFAIVFSTMGLSAAATPAVSFKNPVQKVKPSATTIAIKVVVTSEDDLKNLPEVIELVAASVPSVVGDCTISVTLTISVGIVSVSATASASAPTCREATLIAAKGANDALETARKALM